MNANQTYTITVVTKGTNEEALAQIDRTAKYKLGSMMLLQGSSFRFQEAYSVPSLLDSASTLAKSCEVALVFVGKNDEFESEGSDQASMALPCHQNELITAVAKARPGKTVVVNFSGSPVEMPFADDPNVASILQAWFPGQEAGRAIAKVLTGEITPCGKLATSFPRQIEDNPSYGNFPAGDDDILRYAEGREVGYRFYDREDAPKPRFSFGFGLSYTTFAYTGTTFDRAPATLQHANDTLTLRVTVKNTGSVPGKEIVQVYVAPPDHQTCTQSFRSRSASAAATSDNDSNSGKNRPLKELKGFAKLQSPLAPGKTAQVEIRLDKYSVSYWDETAGAGGAWMAEKGIYRALVAKSSIEVEEEVPFEVVESFSWTGV